MKKIKKIFYYSGTHWDREWYLTFQGFRYHLVDRTDEIIETLENDSDFKTFVFDGQTIVLEDYLKVRPENEKRLRKLIEDERILVGPWYVMPDEFLASGESLIKNLQMGHKLAFKFDAPDAMKYGFVCDMFGHIGQLPQILQGFGIEGALVGRGSNAMDTPAHFMWEAYDGSRVLTFKVPESFGYASFFRDVWEPYTSGQNSDWDELVQRAVAYVENESRRSEASYVMLMDGMDHNRIHPLAPKLAKELEKAFDCPVVFESPETMIEEIMSESLELPVKKGEMNHTTKDLVEHSMLIPHTLSSRYDLKKVNDECQNLLEKWVLPLQLLSKLFTPENAIPATYADLAYDYLIQNHAHDSICGCSIDAVHQDMHYRYRQSAQISQEVIRGFVRDNIGLTDNLPAFIREEFDRQRQDEKNLPPFGPFGPNKTSEGPVLLLDVWNPLPFPRKEENVVELYFQGDYPKFYHEQGSSEKINSFKIFDGKGREIPYTLLKFEKEKFVQIHKAMHPDMRDVYTLSMELDLPALGKATYYILPALRPARYLQAFNKSKNSFENDFYKLQINDNGSLDIHDLVNDRSYKNLHTFVDDSEIGDGWFHVDLVNDRSILSQGFPASVELVKNGVGVSIFRIVKEMKIPARLSKSAMSLERSHETLNLKITSQITCYKNAGHIDIKTLVDNTAQDHRLKVIFPTGITTDRYFADQAFAVVERKTGFNVESGDWKEFDKEERAFESLVYKKDADGNGLAFISKGGLHECAFADDRDATMAITLFRSFEKTFLTNGEVDGQLPGKLEFNYRLLAFGADTTNAALIKLKDALQSGLEYYSTYSLSDKYEASADVLNDSGQRPLLSWDEEEIILSVLKSPEDGSKGILARFYNPSDRAKASTLQLSEEFTEAYEVNLLEELLGELAVDGQKTSIELGAHEIKTILFKL